MTASLRSRVLVVLAVATILPTLLVGLVAIRRARADLEREVVRGQLAHVRALASSLDQTLRGARRALELTAAWWADERTSATARDADAARAGERLLRRLRREVPLFADVSVFDVDGRPLHGTLAAPPDQLGAHSFGGYVGDVEFSEAGPVVPVIAQARSRTGELVAVFIAHLELGFISVTLEEARLGSGARLLVVDSSGVPVAASDPSVQPGGDSLRATSPAVDRALGSTSEGSVISGGVVGAYSNLSSLQSLRGVSWSVILEQPESAAFSLARAMRRDTLIAAGLVLAAALALGAFLATRLTRPLRRLAARADAIAERVADDGTQRAPIDAPGEIGILAHRIEEMARRIDERDELQAALAHGDRLATVGTMAASVAHEINNPLTTILGYSNLLLEDKPDEHPDRTGLELIADEAARMKTIVGGLLDYSRAGESQSDQHSDVGGLLRRTAALLAPTVARMSVSVALDVDDDLPPVAAGSGELQQVFTNLVQNAAQAMPGGGSVLVEARCNPAGDRVCVAVTDEGPGIAPEQRQRVFEPFYTTKSSGTGIGLAVVSHLVSGFSGRIEIGAGPGDVGARISVFIPVARRATDTAK